MPVDAAAIMMSPITFLCIFVGVFCGHENAPPQSQHLLNLNSHAHQQPPRHSPNLPPSQQQQQPLLHIPPSDEIPKNGHRTTHDSPHKFVAEKDTVSGIVGGTKTTEYNPPKVTRNRKKVHRKGLREKDALDDKPSFRRKLLAMFLAYLTGSLSLLAPPIGGLYINGGNQGYTPMTPTQYSCPTVPDASGHYVCDINVGIHMQNTGNMNVQFGAKGQNGQIEEVAQIDVTGNECKISNTATQDRICTIMDDESAPVAPAPMAQPSMASPPKGPDPLYNQSTLQDSGSGVPTFPGWTLEWSDDFSGGAQSLPSSTDWIIDLGHNYNGGPTNWGTGEIQSYTNSLQNVATDGNGNLMITPLRDASGGWTSARIETTKVFKPPAGGQLRIEGRIQLPAVTGAAALGYWPAFWALGSPYRGNYLNWPSIGELDVMENNNGVNDVFATLHCGVAPGGPCHESTGLVDNHACVGPTCQAAFHTYRLEWDATVADAQQLRWYVDDVLYHTINQNQLPADTWTQMTDHAGYFILLNVAIGGVFPDNQAGQTTPTASTQPGAPMIVDYVGVWTKIGS